MAYSENLANRLRERLAEIIGGHVVAEKEMMGGLAFMVNEKMCLGVIKDEMMCRIDPALHAEVIEKPGCRTMDFTKKPMKGWIFVEDGGMKNTRDLDYWIGLALDFNAIAKSSRKKKSVG